MSTDARTRDHADDKRARKKQLRAERLAAEEAARAKAARGKTMALMFGAIVAVAIAVMLTVTLWQATDPTLGVPAASADATAPLAPVPAEAGDDAAIGAIAPEVAGFTVDGDPVTIGGTGTAQAVVFMAHWCGHCQEEAPLIADWVDDGLLPDGVELVAVSTRHDPARTNWPPDEWLDGAGFPGLVMIDHDETAATAWALSGTPMWVFLDDDGRVVWRASGQIGAEQFAMGAEAAAAG